MYNNEFNSMASTPNLGVVNIPYINVPTASPAQPSFWDKFNTISNSILNVGNKVVDTVQNLQNGKTTTQTQLQQQQEQLNQQQQKGNALKYLLIAAGVLAAGGVTYALLKDKKKKRLSGVQETIDVPHTVLDGVKTKKSRKPARRKAKKVKAKKVRI